jgi:hypothetical protein
MRGQDYEAAADVALSVEEVAVVEPVRGFNLFGELSYSDLRFRTPEWRTPANLRPVAGSFPQRLELTGFRLSGGLQITLGTK